MKSIISVRVGRLNRLAIAALFIVTLNSSLVCNADEFTGNLLINSQTPGAANYRVTEYDSSGNLLQTFTPTPSPNSNDLWNTRDLVVGQNGNLHVFNGTFDPYLATYDAVAETWSYRTHTDWSTINNSSYGGIGIIGDNVFVTNMGTAGQNTNGVVMFDLFNGTSSDVVTGVDTIDLTVGLDDSLWVLTSSRQAVQYDTTTFSVLDTVNLNGFNDVRSIAVDANGDFIIGSWSGFVARLDSSGSLINQFNTGFSILDVDISTDGTVAFGSRSDGTWLSDANLNGAIQIESNRWNSFVTFVPDAVPEPNSAFVLLLTGLAIARRKR